MERVDSRIVALEVGLSRTVDDADVEHPLWLQDEVGDDLFSAPEFAGQ